MEKVAVKTRTHSTNTLVCIGVYVVVGISLLLTLMYTLDDTAAADSPARSKPRFVDSLIHRTKLLLRTHDLSPRNDMRMIAELRQLAFEYETVHGLEHEEALALFTSLQLTTMERECQGLTGCWDGVSFYRQQQDYFRLAREFAQNQSSSMRFKEQLVYCETGFNSGLSAIPFLLGGYRVFSFDIMKNRYSPSCAQTLQVLFPGNFTVTAGSSLETIAHFHKKNPQVVERRRRLRTADMCAYTFDKEVLLS